MKEIVIDGIRIPTLGYGTWELRGEECFRGVRSALDIGYRHIDTAQAYGNEAEVGRAMAESGVPREDIFLTTKIWPDRLEPAELRRAAEESLRRLRTDYVDLLLIHWPNPDVPLAGTLGEMDRLRGEGRARSLGVSNFTFALLDEAAATGVRIVNNQVEYHPFLSQRRLLDRLRREDMFLTAYAPLARGEVPRNAVLARIGERYGKSASQVGLRWLVQQDRVAAIPKAGNEKHARANFEIFDFELTPEEMAEIHALRSNMRLVSPDRDWDMDEA